VLYNATMVERIRRHALQHNHLTHFFFPSHCWKGALNGYPLPFFLSTLATLSMCNIVCVVCRTKVLSPWLVCGWCYKLKVSRKLDQITKRFLSMEVFNLGLVSMVSRWMGGVWSVGGWCYKLRALCKVDQITRRFMGMEAFDSCFASMVNCWRGEVCKAIDWRRFHSRWV